MSKRFANVTGEVPVNVAASQILLTYLNVLERHAATLVANEDDGITAVHQLRIATRRLSAAQRAFRDLLPRRFSRRLKRKLCRLRRAAADARRLDVLRPDLIKPPAAETPGVQPWVAELEEERERAGRRIRRAIARLDRRGFWEWARRRIERLAEKHKGAKEPLFDRAREAIVHRLDRLYDKGENIDTMDADELHRLRIAGKKLRYTIDLFANCFPEEVGHSLYDRLKKGLDLLGRANDLKEQSALLLDRTEKKDRDGNDVAANLALASQLRAEQQATIDQFGEYWAHSLGIPFHEELLAALDSPAAASVY